MQLKIIIPVFDCVLYLLNGFVYQKSLHADTIDFEIIDDKCSIDNRVFLRDLNCK